MKKKKVLIVVSSSLIGSFCLLYFLGGYLACLAVNNALFSKRLSTVGNLSEFDAITCKTRVDYPSLQKREEVSFKSNGNLLRGYFYSVSEAKGTFLVVHGLNGYSDGPIASLDAFLLSQNYDVFAIDLTSSGQSEGNGISSLAQGAYDVKAALEYLFEQGDFYAPLSSLYLLGYSWGAYSVCASLNFDYASPISGVISISGFDTMEGEMLSIARNYVGGLADFNALTFDWGLATIAGEDRHLSSADGISSFSGKAYLIQGDSDAIVSKEASTYQAVNEGPRVKKKLKEGFAHSLSWISPDAKKMREELRERYDKLGKEDYASSLTEAEKEKANELDEETFLDALRFLEG